MTALLLLSWQPPALALDTYSYMAPGAEVSLSWHKTDVRWQIAQQPRSGTHYKLKLMGFEAPFRWVQGGLQLGYQELTQSDNPATAGLRQTGEFIGIQLRSPPPHGSWGPFAAGSYRYNAVDGSTDTQRTETTWHEYDLEAGVILRRGPLDLSAGAYYADLSGSQTASGIITANSDIDSEPNTGLSLGVGLQVEPAGRFLISSRFGRQRSFAIGFSRNY